MLCRQRRVAKGCAGCIEAEELMPSKLNQSVNSVRVVCQSREMNFDIAGANSWTKCFRLLKNSRDYGQIRQSRQGDGGRRGRSAWAEARVSMLTGVVEEDLERDKLSQASKPAVP